jgi:hypothetical protein
VTILQEIKAKLDALGTLGTIKIGFMPAGPDVMGCLYEYGGLMPDRGFGVAGIQYEYPSIQLVFRGAPFDYSGPRDKAEIAYRYFVTIQPGALGSGVTTNYLKLTPMQSPHPVMAIDANSRHTIGINIRVEKELS